ncbi:Pre-mRNA-processing ATP-dependent RNA helicase PRP5 at N-terminal half [Coccomyxa sp. Obi]|nr:Pre-mRNA-processing ATP-dependent RNA helicase PRP5 at N-terminal half [Coccomyxa sp. Obi]
MIETAKWREFTGSPNNTRGCIFSNRMQADSLKKNFYSTVREVRRKTAAEVEHSRRLGGVVVAGNKVPKPVSSWTQCSLGLRLLEILHKRQYVVPTAFQANALPALLMGRDGLYVARKRAGSILSMAERTGGRGSVALFITSAVHRVHKIRREMMDLFPFNVASACPGTPLSAEVFNSDVMALISTPDFLTDIIAQDSTSLRRISFLVFDDTNALLRAGLGPQLASLVHSVRQLSMELLIDPVLMIAGMPMLLDRNVEHCAILAQSTLDKEEMLVQRVDELHASSRIIVFTNDDSTCASIHQRLKQAGLSSLAVYQGLDQDASDDIIMDFNRDICHVIVANGTLVSLLHGEQPAKVINFGAPLSPQSYVDCATCAGCTHSSQVVTLLTNDEGDCAQYIANIFQESRWEVPSVLAAMAEANRLKVIGDNTAAQETAAADASAGRSDQDIFHPEVEVPSDAAAIVVAAVRQDLPPKGPSQPSSTAEAASTTTNFPMDMPANKDSGTAPVETRVLQQRTALSTAAAGELESTADSPPAKNKKHDESSTAETNKQSSHVLPNTAAVTAQTTKGLTQGMRSEHGASINVHATTSSGAKSDPLLSSPKSQRSPDQADDAALHGMHSDTALHQEKATPVAATAGRSSGAKALAGTEACKAPKTRWDPPPSNPPPVPNNGPPTTPASDAKSETDIPVGLTVDRRRAESSTTLSRQ